MLEYDPDLFISMAWHQFASIVSKHNFICFHGCDKVLPFITRHTSTEPFYAAIKNLHKISLMETSAITVGISYVGFFCVLSLTDLP